MKRILRNSQPEHVIVEYLFIEYAEEQAKPVNDDQGYQYGFINTLKSDFTRSDSLAEFRDFLFDDLSFSARTYDHFKRKSVELTDYKFAVVESSGKITEYAAIDAKMMNELGKAARGLMIVGKNLDLHAVQETATFRTWFDTYVKGTTSRGAREEDYV
jgi:hypothetical protein